MVSSSPVCVNDGSFGPVVHGCRGNFDFTVTFELIFLSIVPSGLFVAISIARIAFLTLQNRVVRASAFQYAKLALVSASVVLALVQVAFRSVDHALVSRHLSLAAGALVLVAALCMLPLSFLEHQRCPRPSVILETYLFLTVLFDVVQTRTAWLDRAEASAPHVAGPVVSSLLLAVKVLILIAESVEKPKWLLVKDDEPTSREETSGIFNLGVFFWLNRLFLRGYSGVMTIHNLYPLDGAMSSRNLHRRLAPRLKSLESDQPGHLKWALARALAWPLLLPVAPRIAYIGFTFAQPFFISSLISHLQQAPETTTTDWFNNGKGLIGASVFIYSGAAISMALYRYFVQRSMYMARGCLASAIYRKTTAAPVSTAATSSDGLASVTLMSTDIERIVRGFYDLHEVWANFIEIVLGCWMLEKKLGLAFLSPIVIIVLCLAVMAWVAKVAGRVQAEWMGRIQTRVGMTAMAISHLKRLKIAGLEAFVRERILNLRLEDLNVGGRFRSIQILAAVISYAPQCLSPVFAFALGGRGLDVETMYTALSFLVLLTNPLAIFFQSIPVLLSGFTCLDRIDVFLTTDSRHDPRSSPEKPASRWKEAATSAGSGAGKSEEEGGGYELKSLPEMIHPSSGWEGTRPKVVSITGGQFGWKPHHPVLHDISFAAYEGQLVIFAGPVASGKSTFCKAILGEVPSSRGRIEIHPSMSRVAFCDQEPFIMAGTIKENITRFAPFDSQRYRDVIHATDLEKDISTFAEGDNTRLESGGLALSGGQRQRLALARALYLDCSLFVIDDALGGLDSTTESIVFERCFGPRGLLRCRRATVLLSTHSTRHLRDADHIVVLGDDGRVSAQGSFDHLDKGGGTGMGAVKNASEDRALRPEPSRLDDDTQGPSSTTTDAIPSPTPLKAYEDSIDDQSRQTGDIRVYKSYLNSISFTPLLLLAVGGAVYAFGVNFPTLWIGFWSDNTLDRGFAFYTGIYALTRSVQLISLMATAVLVMVIMVRLSGIELHRATLDTVLKAPIAIQMAMNVGRVTNLFSQDMTILDSELPLSLLNFTAGLFEMIGMAVVMAVPSPWLAISYPGLFALIWLLQKFYLRTSRQLRLLDLEAKTPLYAHFLDTIQGTATLRAYGWTEAEVQCNYELLDTSQRPAYLLAMAQQWLTLVLGLIVATIAVMMTVLTTQLHTDSSFTGASLVALMSFGELVAGIVRAYTQLETSIGAVSRLRSFSTKVPREDEFTGDVLEPEETWPHNGNVEMKNIYAAYDTSMADGKEVDESGLVLRGVNLSISAGHKVAICGRTGSGKSSLILVLLRLLDPLNTSTYEPGAPWSFTIDGVPVERIRRTTLRQRVIAVPQDCVFLPEGASLKENLDLTGSFSEAECLAVLDKVNLGRFAAECGGLDGVMSTSQLSAGQKQLFGMARTILRRQARDRTPAGIPAGGGPGGGVLVLDEMSSSVDDETEALMHELVREYFASYTVIMVAHRLDSLSHYADQIVVMDAGRIVETGPPGELLERHDGWFKRLVQAG